jgi:hypothetical protein
VAVPIAILAAPGLLWLRAHTACNGGPTPEGEPQMPTSTPTRTRGDTTRTKRRKRSSCLGRYREDTTGATRVIVALPAPAGATLVVDRLAGTKADARVLARIAAEEDAGNAELVASMYLADENRGRCRELTAEDLEPMPKIEGGENGEASENTDSEALDYAGGVVDDHGVRYCVRVIEGGEGAPAQELRWAREDDSGGWEAVTLRETIAQFESYEPLITMTRAAVDAHSGDRAIGVSTLRLELRRQEGSPIVLNRGLREAVLRAVAQQNLSLSEIAARCGRRHSGCDDLSSGDTTWLQRRIGIKREAGSDAPTSWVHTEVLALIARDGLGLAPHEVEL